MPLLDQTKLYLSRAIRRQRLGHAILAIGRNETSLQIVVDYLAMVLLCESLTETDEIVNPCGRCKDCVMIANNKHVNLSFVTPEPTKDIRIDQVREVRENLRLSSFDNKPKLFVFRNANSFTNQAANALLKSIEEPNPNQFFLLLCTSSSSLQKTLLSRCQRLTIPCSTEANLPSEEQAGLQEFAQYLLMRVQKNDFLLRAQLIEEVLKHSCDKTVLLCEIQRMLHEQLRNSTTLSARRHLLKSLEATVQTQEFLKQNVNPQLTLEHWLLKSWPM